MKAKIVLKQILGVILLLFSFLLTISTITTTFKTLAEMNKTNPFTTLGALFMSFVFVVIIYYSVKSGLRLIRNRPNNNE